MQTICLLYSIYRRAESKKQTFGRGSETANGKWIYCTFFT